MLMSFSNPAGTYDQVKYFLVKFCTDRSLSPTKFWRWVIWPAVFLRCRRCCALMMSRLGVWTLILQKRIPTILYPCSLCVVVSEIICQVIFFVLRFYFFCFCNVVRTVHSVVDSQQQISNHAVIHRRREIPVKFTSGSPQPYQQHIAESPQR